MDQLTELIPQQRESPEGKTDASLAHQASRLFSEASLANSNSTPAHGAYIARVCKERGLDPALLGEKLVSDEKAVKGLIIRAIHEHGKASEKNPGMARHLPTEEEVRTRMLGILQGTFAEAKRMMILPDEDLQAILDKDEEIHSYRSGEGYDLARLEAFAEKRIAKAKDRSPAGDKKGSVIRRFFSQFQKPQSEITTEPGTERAKQEDANIPAQKTSRETLDEYAAKSPVSAGDRT